MISNPAPVLVRPEANGQNAPVPPHDALCTQLNPLVQVQCASVQCASAVWQCSSVQCASVQCASVPVCSVPVQCAT